MDNEPTNKYEDCHCCGAPVDITKRHWRVHLDAAGREIKMGSIPDDDRSQIGTFALGEDCAQVLLDLGVTPEEREELEERGEWPTVSCRRRFRYARKVEPSQPRSHTAVIHSWGASVMKRLF